jgi:hypothetical protein
MESLQIKQYKYFKVVEIFGIRFINIKKPGVSIKIDGEMYYKLASIGYQ